MAVAEAVEAGVAIGVFSGSGVAARTCSTATSDRAAAVETTRIRRRRVAGCASGGVAFRGVRGFSQGGGWVGCFGDVRDAGGGWDYGGHTEDPGRRLGMLERGVIAGYTSARLPVQLVWSEAVATREEAIAGERRLKG